MAKAIHMMFRVLDEPRSIKFYDDAFGLKVADCYAFDSFTLVYLSNSEQPFEIELTINHGRTEPYDVTGRTPFWFRATASSASRAPLGVRGYGRKTSADDGRRQSDRLGASSRGTNVVATGSAAPMVGKSYTTASKPTGPGQFTFEPKNGSLVLA